MADSTSWLVADDLTWEINSPDGPIVSMSFEQLDLTATMQDGRLIMFSYQPAALEGEPPQPRQYRAIKVERLPGT